MASANGAVRRAGDGDAPAIAELWLRSRRASPGIPPAAHTDDEVHRWVRDLLLPACEVWVAVEEGALAGMMALHAERVEQLYVSPDHRRRGHGTRLLEVAKATRGALTLWTFELNLGARRFYEAQGFAQSGGPSSDNEERTAAVCYRWERGRL